MRQPHLCNFGEQAVFVVAMVGVAKGLYFGLKRLDFCLLFLKDLLMFFMCELPKWSWKNCLQGEMSCFSVQSTFLMDVQICRAEIECNADSLTERKPFFNWSIWTFCSSISARYFCSRALREESWFSRSNLALGCFLEVWCQIGKTSPVVANLGEITQFCDVIAFQIMKLVVESESVVLNFPFFLLLKFS